MNARPGQDPRESVILDALYLKVDSEAVERAEQAMCEIIRERDALAADLVAAQEQAQTERDYRWRETYRARKAEDDLAAALAREQAAVDALERIAAYGCGCAG